MPAKPHTREQKHRLAHTPTGSMSSRRATGSATPARSSSNDTVTKLHCARSTPAAPLAMVTGQPTPSITQTGRPSSPTATCECPLGQGGGHPADEEVGRFEHVVVDRVQGRRAAQVRGRR